MNGITTKQVIALRDPLITSEQVSARRDALITAARSGTLIPATRKHILQGRPIIRTGVVETGRPFEQRLVRSPVRILESIDPVQPSETMSPEPRQWGNVLFPDGPTSQVRTESDVAAPARGLNLSPLMLAAGIVALFLFAGGN